MMKSKSLRITLFSGIVLVMIFGGVCVSDGLARPLLDRFINLTVSGSPTDYSRVGQVISYVYQVRNTASFLLYNVSVEDNRADVACPGTELEVGGQMTCTGSYVITQEDIEHGSLSNEARVEGTYKVESGQNAGCCGGTIFEYYDVAAEAGFTIGGPMYSIRLLVDAERATFFWADEEIAYSYFVRNTGTGSLDGPITIQDDMVQVTCPDGGLEPGETMECMGDYTTTIADVEAMAIHNSAVVHADHDATASDDFVVVLEPAPSLLLEKSAPSTTYTQYWQLVVYNLTVTNTGNVAIAGPFQIHDPVLDEWSCPESMALGLGESLTCLGYYRIRFRVERPITNCATVEGLFQDGPVTTNEACTQITYVPPSAPPEPTPTFEDPE